MNRELDEKCNYLTNNGIDKSISLIISKLFVNIKSSENNDKISGCFEQLFFKSKIIQLIRLFYGLFEVIDFLYGEIFV